MAAISRTKEKMALQHRGAAPAIAAQHRDAWADPRLRCAHRTDDAAALAEGQALSLKSSGNSMGDLAAGLMNVAGLVQDGGGDNLGDAIRGEFVWGRHGVILRHAYCR
jgi:hypothetical protein